MRHDARLAALADALNAADLSGRGAVVPHDLAPVPTAGVAHDHYVVSGTERLVRAPRLSQTSRAAADNLRYQAACFARAAPSGVTPRLHGTLPVSPDLPMGALVVDYIAGRPVRLPGDLPAIARCLAAIHRLPVPAAPAPLPCQDDPVAALMATIEDQAAWLDRAGLHPDAAGLIAAEIADARAHARMPGQAAARCLVVTDSHPGNYLVDPQAKAWFVDLEKAVYSHPAIDVAHVTLPTSVGWDRRVRGTLAPADVQAFESAYLAALPGPLRARVAPALAVIRRLVWLRTVTWFARWRARSGRDGDPWSAADLPRALSAHMRRHTSASLTPAALRRTRALLPAW